MIVMRVIPIQIQNKNILVQKNNDNYIAENELKLALEDIIKDTQLELEENKKYDLSNFCDSMFSIIYKGIIKTLENINNNDISIENLIFEVC
jgi:hypothetical protein